MTITVNDITGDLVASKPASDLYLANYDSIFRKTSKLSENDTNDSSNVAEKQQNNSTENI